MDKKEINDLEKEIKQTFKKIDKVKKNGQFLFRDRNSEYWKCDNKYYSISLHHSEDGDVWCGEYELEDMEVFLAEAKEDNESEINGSISRIRLNSLYMKEEYERKIQLLGVKL